MLKRTGTMVLLLALIILLPRITRASDWSFQLDNIYWGRENPNEQVLWENRSGTPYTTALDANELNFNNANNFRLTLMNESLFGEGIGLELSYYGLNTTAADTRKFNSATLTLPYENSFTVTSSSHTDYVSNLSNYELNFRYCLADWATLVGGVRCITLRENLDFSTVRFISVSTYNHLIGPQIGFDLHSPPQNAFGVVFVCKTGFYNQSDISNILPFISTNSPQTNLTQGSIRQTDFDLGFRYRGGDHLQIRAGYYLAIFDGVALASEQLTLSDKNAIKTGTTKYRGAYLTAEILF